MGERLDLRVHDSVALDEIELYAEVLSAVAVSDHPLTSEELDEALGIGATPGGRAPGTPAICGPALVIGGWCLGSLRLAGACSYMTSVLACANPSAAYSRIAAVFSPST